MVQNTKARIAAYSLRTLCDFKGKVLEDGFDGMLLDINNREVNVRFIGRFNASNLLAVYGAACLLGKPSEEVLIALSTLCPVAGRFDALRSRRGYTAIVDYATTNTLNLVSLSDDELAAIQEAYPFLIRDDLAAGTYTGQDADVTCVAIQATLVASEELSEDVVYEFVKAMFDNKDALTEGHAKFGFLDPETASAGATVTMHPGAEKYYKEIGVL